MQKSIYMHYSKNLLEIPEGTNGELVFKVGLKTDVMTEHLFK